MNGWMKDYGKLRLFGHLSILTAQNLLFEQGCIITHQTTKFVLSKSLQKIFLKIIYQSDALLAKYIFEYFLKQSLINSLLLTGARKAGGRVGVEWVMFLWRGRGGGGGF